MTQLYARLHRALTEPECGWSMGSFGAIAEFHHVAGELPPEPGRESPLRQLTGRGAIRFTNLNGVRPVAHETLVRSRERWSQSVSLCLPHNEAAMSQRQVLTELGPDRDAIRRLDSTGVLFDMGLGAYQVDFCIRTTNQDLITTLRRAEGRSLFAPDNPVMPAILANHPHRVALTKLGRVEVYQPIGGPDTENVSPQGPHTHVLPKLLVSKRTHSSNTPIPAGWVPCAGWHPTSPVSDSLGVPKSFDIVAFEAFQTLLQDWGAAEYVSAKEAAWMAMDAGKSAHEHPGGASKLSRVGTRIAIRQKRRRHGETPLVDQWGRIFDRQTRV